MEAAKTEMRKTKITIIEAPSNLGLIEPIPGREPGTKKLPVWLKSYGFYQVLMPEKVIVVEPPEYSMKYDEQTGVRNADLIIRYSKHLAKVINEEIKKDHFPVVIGGDCSILIGCTLALKYEGQYGLFFIDGHTDFVPPHTSLTKGAAGMDLAIVTGYGHPKISNINEMQPYIDEKNTLAYGNRELEDNYVQHIKASGIEYFDLLRIRETGISKVVRNYIRIMTENNIDGVWIHLDVDVLNDAIMPCVDSRSPGGLTYGELRETLIELFRSELIKGIDLTILDPDLDPRGIYTKRFINELESIFKTTFK